jgi:hypothetical protein
MVTITREEFGDVILECKLVLLEFCAEPEAKAGGGARGCFLTPTIVTPDMTIARDGSADRFYQSFRTTLSKMQSASQIIRSMV